METLARALAPATQIEQGLLRAMRRAMLPGSSPAVEARFWRSELIGSHGEFAVTWDLQAVRDLRARLREERVTLDDARLRIVARMHEATPALHRLEERLIALDIVRPARWDTNINTILRGVLRKLIEVPPEEAVELARWALRALTDIGFDPPANARETARDLLYAAALRVGRLPQADGPLRASADAPPWVITALSEATSESASKLMIAVHWTASGLRIDPNVSGDGHDIEIPDMPLPAVAVRWEIPDGQTSAPDQWISAHAAGIVRPPEDMPQPLGAMITAQDGGRWRIEDANRADALSPLRILVMTAWTSERELQLLRPLYSRLESLRQLAGFHHAVPILMKSVRLEEEASSRVDRSLWRVIQRELVDWASHVVVVVTEALASPTWTWEVLRIVGDKFVSGTSIARADGNALPSWSGTHYGAVIAFVLDSRTPFRESERYSALRNEFPWLTGAPLVAPDGGASEPDFAQLVDRIFTDWRQGKPARPPKDSDPAEPARAANFARALHSLALSFHLHTFAPPPPAEGFRAPFFGLDNLPEWNVPVPGFRNGEFNLAEVDLHHVRFQAEYVFRSQVVDYLIGGQDPFQPAVHPLDFERGLAQALEAASNGERQSAQDGVRAMRAFASFADGREVAKFTEQFGDPHLIANWLEQPNDTPPPQWIAQLRANLAAVARAIRRFDAEIYKWRLQFPASICESLTFPEYIEGLTGLLVHYLHSAAEHDPNMLVACSYEIEPEAHALIREAFLSSFVSTERIRAPAQFGNLPEDALILRMPNFADLVARLADAVIWGVRTEAARRLQSQREEQEQTREVEELPGEAEAVNLTLSRPPSVPIVRRFIEQLNDTAVRSMRAGFQALYDAKGPNSYSFLAGIGGSPSFYYPSRRIANLKGQRISLYLPWHRGYFTTLSVQRVPMCTISCWHAGTGRKETYPTRSLRKKRLTAGRILCMPRILSLITSIVTR
jgi:hypothetical protein